MCWVLWDTKPLNRQRQKVTKSRNPVYIPPRQQSACVSILLHFFLAPPLFYLPNFQLFLFCTFFFFFAVSFLYSSSIPPFCPLAPAPHQPSYISPPFVALSFSPNPTQQVKRWSICLKLRFGFFP